MSDGVGSYLSEIGRIPLLSKDEEILLGKQVKEWMELPELKQPSNKQKRIIRVGRRAKERMVKANLRLVVHIAKKHQQDGLRNLDLMDLVQEGTLGLTRGVEKFDPERGYKLSTYCYWWIKQGITRAIANQERSIRLPINCIDVQRRITKYLDTFKDEHGRFPTFEECAEASNVTLPTLRAYIEHVDKPTSLDQVINSEVTDKTLLELVVSNDKSPEEELETQSCLDQLEALLAQLPERNRQMLELRYGLKNGGKPMSYLEVGEIMEISRERVRQIEITSLKKMRLKLYGKTFS